MGIAALTPSVLSQQRAIGILVCEICGEQRPLTGATGLRSQGRRFCRDHSHEQGCRVNAVLGGGVVISLG